MATFRIKAEDLNKHIRARNILTRNEITKGIKIAALQGAAYVAREADKMDITDLGQYSNSWRRARPKRISTKGRYTPTGFVITNYAPHAGIVELGRRPGPVSEEGQKRIYRWVRRKLYPGLNPRRKADRRKLQQVAFAITRYMTTHAIKGRYVVQNSLPALSAIASAHMNRSVQIASGKPTIV